MKLKDRPWLRSAIRMISDYDRIKEQETHSAKTRSCFCKIETYHTCTTWKYANFVHGYDGHNCQEVSCRVYLLFLFMIRVICVTKNCCVVADDYLFARSDWVRRLSYSSVLAQQIIPKVYNCLSIVILVLAASCRLVRPLLRSTSASRLVQRRPIIP